MLMLMLMLWQEEEEEEDGDDGRPPGVYRRLVFLKNEGVVQTEVGRIPQNKPCGVGPLILSSENPRSGLAFLVSAFMSK